MTKEFDLPKFTKTIQALFTAPNNKEESQEEIIERCWEKYNATFPMANKEHFIRVFKKGLDNKEEQPNDKVNPFKRIGTECGMCRQVMCICSRTKLAPQSDKLSAKELREKQAWENGYQFRERMLKVQPIGISDKEIAESGRIFAEGQGQYEELLSLTYSQAARDMRDKFLSHYNPPQSEKEEVGEQATLLNYSLSGLFGNKEGVIKSADTILAEYEDKKEFHFMDVDRVWLIEAMEEYKNQSTPKINLKELRDKYRQEWNAKGEINFFNGIATPMAIFNWFVTELKLKEE